MRTRMDRETETKFRQALHDLLKAMGYDGFANDALHHDDLYRVYRVTIKALDRDGKHAEARKLATHGQLLF
jgi:hypothetical protein